MRQLVVLAILGVPSLLSAQKHTPKHIPLTPSNGPVIAADQDERARAAHDYFMAELAREHRGVAPTQFRLVRASADTAIVQVEHHGPPAMMYRWMIMTRDSVSRAWRVIEEGRAILAPASPER